MADILVISPHPDDDVLGCGGVIARHAAAGDLVTIAYLTSGESGSLDRGKEELREIRETEARNAATVLQAHRALFMRWPDGGLELKPQYVLKLTSLVREVRPERVYLPHAGESTLDHRAAHQLACEALRRAAGPWFQECPGIPWAVGEVFGYEVWSPLQDPSVFADVTPYYDLKLKALRSHKSQLARYPYDEAVKGLNRYRGAMGGGAVYCECFQVLKMAFRAGRDKES